MRVRSVIILTFSLVSFCFAKSHDQSEKNHVTLIKTNQRTLIFEYKIPQIHFHTVIIKDRKYLIPIIKGEGISQKPGFPMLPYKEFVIGIPPTGTPNVKIINRSYVDTVGIYIAPYIDKKSLTIKKNSKYPSSMVMNKIQGDIYSTDSFIPEKVLNKITKISFGWLRHQRIMKIKVNPVLFNPVENRTRLYSKIRIEINFNNNIISSNIQKESDKTNSDNYFENIYRSVLVNYNQAIGWRNNSEINTVSNTKEGISQELKDISIWYKFYTDTSGIYKITYESLLNAGVNPRGTNINNIHIFNGGGKELPLSLSSQDPVLKEIPTYFIDRNGNDVFDPGDLLIFYAKGTSGWENNTFSHQLHHYINYYTKYNAYWLAIGGGQRKEMTIRNYSPSNVSQLKLIEKYHAYYYKEKERIFPDYQLNSGVNWYWDNIAGSQVKNYKLTLHDVMPNDTAKLFVDIKGWTEVPHPMTLILNDTLSFSNEVQFTINQIIEHDFVGGLVSGTNTLTIKSSNSSLPGFNLSYLDWIEIHYWSQLRAENNNLVFNTPKSNGYYKYHILNFDADTAFTFDISNQYNVQRIDNLSYDKKHFTLNIIDSVGNKTSHKIITLSSANFQTVNGIKLGSNPLQGLRDTTNSADYLIIAHPSLMGSVLNELVSHLKNQNLWPNQKVPSVKVVNVQDIYDKFSWGMFDPTAIRNFLRYTYYHWQKAPTYVLLVGKACYDFKNNAGNSLPNLIPTYEGETIGTDDWFVYLTKDGFMDMIIGRLPALNRNELNSMVQKIIAYDDQPDYGTWKNTILLAADDENSPENNPDMEKYFTIESEELADFIIPKSYNLSKVYLMDYPYKDLGGNKPGARAAFIDNYSKGNLIVNFIGHGNFQQLADETLFYAPSDVQKLKNGNKLPVFIAATCGAGRFDGNNPTLTCMGEKLLRMPIGGAIASVAATRWGLNTANYLIDKSFIGQVLGTKDGVPKTFGEAMVIAKNTSGYTDFTRMIDLLGLPSEYIAKPKGRIDITSYPDTLRTSTINKINGKITYEGNIVNNFNGKASIRAFDSDTVKTEERVNVNYSIPGGVLLDTLWDVKNGIFDSTITLKNVSIKKGNTGRISIYAWGNIGNKPFDAAGGIDSISTISDITSVMQHDTSGPIIFFDINGKNSFSNEEPVGFNPILNINLTDYGSGLNLYPSYGIHLMVDNDSSKAFNLTPYYSGDLNTGKIKYAVPDMEPGKHSFEIIAWDMSHNRSEKKFNLVVGLKDLLSNVYTYPNPSTSSTSFSFYLNKDANVRIKVYTVAGRLIKEFNFLGQAGLNVFPRDKWNLTDQDGNYIANGVYFYKVIATPFQGSHAEKIGKLAIIR